MLPRHLPLRPRIEAFRRDAWIEAVPRLGQDAPQLLAFCGMIAGGLGSRPVRQHRLKWLTSQFRMSL
jgi:hypothetical protein